MTINKGLSFFLRVEFLVPGPCIPVHLCLTRIPGLNKIDTHPMKNPSQSELLILAVYRQYLGSLKVLEQFLSSVKQS